MHQKRNLSEPFGDLLKNLNNLLIVGSVTGQSYGPIQGISQPDHPLFKPVVLVGKRQPRPGLSQHAGDAPGDAPVVGDAENDSLLAGQVYGIQDYLPLDTNKSSQH
jgi:hypothetical protein